MEDEYIRNYAFDPEFIRRKSESDRCEKEPKMRSEKLLESRSEEDFEEEMIEAEVHSFRSVKKIALTRHDSINHA